MHRIVRVTSPSRLHFGLLRFASETDCSFGGLGMMINKPRTKIELSPSSRLELSGLPGEKAHGLLRLAADRWLSSDLGYAKLDILEAPAPHSGLGSGTQLALSIAAGVHALVNEGPFDLSELVAAMGRARRSAVGSYGFQLGGLVWESGKLPGETFGNLASRVTVPEHWRVLLIRFPDAVGLHGESEKSAFRSLPPVDKQTTEKLIELAEQQILPAAVRADFEEFSEGIYRYGLLAGSCFALAQGSPFASPQIGQVIQLLREMNIRGVGQSSWGPTIFAFCPHREAADELVGQLRQHPQFATALLEVSAPDNRGAQLEVLDEILK